MNDAIYKFLAIPETCYLGKRVFKNLFLKNAQLGKADEKAFDRDVDSIIWQYAIKPATVPVASYRDDQREYLEIAVLQTNLHGIAHCQRIAEAIHRAIPYPLVLVLACDSRVAISVANKRFNQVDNDKIITDEILLTDWLDPDFAVSTGQDFLGSLTFKALPLNNMYILYCGYIQRIIAHQCAKFSGQYKLDAPGTDWRTRLARLAECQRIEENISQLRRALKAETQFNRQVELNMRIKAMEKELTLAAANL